MRSLVYIFHCLPQNAVRYRDELARREIDAEVIPIVLNGFSSVYRALAVKERTHTYLDGLLSHHPPKVMDPGDDGTVIVLVSWSAGYGYTTVLLSEEASAQAVDGVIFIDSCYSTIDKRTGAVQRGGLLAEKRYADRAKRPSGTSVLWFGYADVPTSGQLSTGQWTGYGSTQQTADELHRWTGGASGGFRTRFFDTKRGARGNHMAAILEWGPGWLADALEQLRARRVDAGLEVHPSRQDVPAGIDSIEEAELSPMRTTIRNGATGELVREWQMVLSRAGYKLKLDGGFGPITAIATRSYQAARGLVADGIVGPLTWETVDSTSRPSEPSSEPPALSTVGEIALQVAREYQTSGLAEIPGAGAHPVILAAFACCERGGRIGAVALQSDEEAWCAAFFSMCQLESERRLGLTRAETGFIPRAAVWELHRDAELRAEFFTATEVRSGSYLPRPGDAWIQVRQGCVAGPPGSPFAHSRGFGHVGRIVSWNDTSGETIDGNINNRVSAVTRTLDDPALVGIVS